MTTSNHSVHDSVDAEFTGSGDDEFLDRVFERLVSALEDGRTSPLEPYVAMRPHLRDALVDLGRLASELAIGPRRHWPSVPGYKIVGELGHGGMGAVYLAHQERLGGRKVALKFLPESAALSARARSRFVSEAHGLGRLHHPHVVPVYDVIEHEHLIAYSMEWIDGRSLGDLIHEFGRTDIPSAQAAHVTSGHDAEGRHSASASLPTPHRTAIREPSLSDVRVALDSPADAVPSGTYTTFICRTGIAIARALSAVHAAGLLHRDVKPSNILLRRDGSALLSDFGLVRETDSTVTEPGQFAGTPAYASPEQLRGESDKLDARSDVYSLGVTLYHALALQLPYRGRTPDELSRRIERAAFTPLRHVNPRVPVDLQTIVAKCMDSDPARRYASAADLAEDLERLLSLQPIHARPAGLVTRSLKLARRKRGTLLAAGLGGAAALMLAAALFVYSFLIPRWVEAHLREARLGLLSPDHATHIISEAVWGRISPRWQAEEWAGRFEVPLAHYSRALRLAPFDTEIGAERDLVAAIAAGGPPRQNSPRQARDPSRSSDGQHPAREVTPLRQTGPALAAEGPDALRLFGLRAFLLHDMPAAIDAWSRYERTCNPAAPPDPFVVAALGILFLAEEKPAQAYPRLRDAAQAFPDVGFLTEYLADAAIQCGDLAEGRRLLERAAMLGNFDPLGARLRLEGDLAAAEGRIDEAARAYQAQVSNPVAQRNYARLLARNGRIEEACNILRSWSHLPALQSLHRQLAAQWWSSLSPRDRLRRIRAALDENPHDPASLVARLRLFAVATEARSHEAAKGTTQAAEPPSHGATKRRQHATGATDPDVSRSSAPGPDPQHGEVREEEGVRLPPSWLRGSVASWLFLRLFPALADSLSAPSLQSLSLSELAIRMEVEHMSLWNRIPSYPRILKELHLAAWRWQVLRPFAWVADSASQTLRISGPEQGLSAPRWLRGVRRATMGAALIMTVSTVARAQNCPNAPCFQGLGDLPGGVFHSEMNGLSDDGQTVVGQSASGNGLEAFRWTAGSGILGLGDAPGGSFYSWARAVTPDGSVVVGVCETAAGREAFRWTSANGIVPLGDLPGGPVNALAHCVSDDGDVIGGVSLVSSGSEAFRWTSAGGMVSIGDFPGGLRESAASGMTPDGNVMVGYGGGAGPLYEALRWSVSDGLQNLGDIPGDDVDGSLIDVTADGLMAVGRTRPFHGGGQRDRAMRWRSATGLELMGDLPGGEYDSYAVDITPGGELAAGYGNSDLGTEAVLWDASNNIARVADLLANGGASIPAGWTLRTAYGVALNGNVVTVAGTGTNPDGNTEAWIARFTLNTPCTEAPCGLYSYDRATTKLVRIDPSTGEVEEIGTVNPAPISEFISDMAYHEGRIRGVGFVGEQAYLYTIHPVTADLESTVPLTLNGSPITRAESLASDDTNLYVSWVSNPAYCCSSDAIGTVATNGAVTLVASFPQNTPPPGDEGIDFDDLVVDSTGQSDFLALNGVNFGVPGQDRVEFFRIEASPPSVAESVLPAFGTPFLLPGDLEFLGQSLYVIGLEYPSQSVSRLYRIDPATGAPLGNVVLDRTAEYSGLAYVSEPVPLLGDMNCDGVLSVSDIGGFVLALTNPAGYASQFPNCDIGNADLNADGTISVSDIGAFVDALTNGFRNA